MKGVKIGVLGIFLSLLSSSVFAGSVTTTPKATATLASSCKATIGNISFGDVVPGQASSTASTTINVLCTKGSNYSFSIAYPTDGTECPLMNGLTKGDKIYYATFIGSTMQAWNQYNTGAGTGSDISYTLQGMVQPPLSTWPAGNGCKARTTIYTGFNPYVTPDNYSGNATLNLTF